MIWQDKCLHRLWQVIDVGGGQLKVQVEVDLVSLGFSDHPSQVRVEPALLCAASSPLRGGACSMCDQLSLEG